MTDAERIARAFHESYERQAPAFSYQTRKASAVPWEYVPEDNKCLMIAVVDELIHAGVIQPGNFEVQERTTGVASDDRLREHMDCVNQGRCWMTVRQEAVEGPCPALASWQAARQRAFAPLSGCTCGASGGMDGHALTCGLNRVSFGRDDV
jgi:hypothetical protein